jgi:uncharacterized protein (TIGR01777 family)
MRVIITGGSGLIGRELTKSLSNDGHEVIILTRNPKQDPQLPESARQVKWDAKSADGWGELADGAGAIINLAGEGIADSRWNEERKKRIYASRVDAGRAVMAAIGQATAKPKVLIQSSAVGYYGSRQDEPLSESASCGTDFLSQVCFDWEASTAGAEGMGVRRAVIRTGIVLSNEGGAWPRIVLPYKFFAGGPLGNGKQYWPWIHMADEVGSIRFLLDNEAATGVFNLSAPEPLTNRDFGAKLGDVMKRPSLLPVPAFALNILFGEMSTVLLDGQRAIPQHLQELGYKFQYPSAQSAFAELL